MRVHVATIVQPGQRVDQRKTQAFIDRQTQLIREALSAELRADPECGFLRCERCGHLGGQQIIRAQIERAGLRLARVGRAGDQDRRMARFRMRAQFRHQPETIAALREVCADHE